MIFWVWGLFLEGLWLEMRTSSKEKQDCEFGFIWKLVIALVKSLADGASDEALSWW